MAQMAGMTGVPEDMAEVSADRTGDQMEDPGGGQAGDRTVDQVAVAHLDQVLQDRAVRVRAVRDHHRRRRLTRILSCWSTPSPS